MSTARGGALEPWQVVKSIGRQLRGARCREGAPVIKPAAQRALLSDLWVLLPAFEDAC